ncbi:MAG TPA: aminotransferase class I/II-fold pyridoxal phosphate-dependent enzyme [Chitinophagaceae bacterium]
MSYSIHRRAWLRQSSLALAGLTFAGKLTASENNNAFYRGWKTPADGPIRLTSNENPYGPSPLARKAMADAIVASNRYPWDTTTILREQLGSRAGLTREHVLMGAGSSEILGLVAQHAALNKGNAIAADPTFQIWIPSAQKLGLEIIRVPLTADKKHDLSSMLSRLNNSTRLMYVCNPNNPTGTLLPASDVQRFIEEVSKKCMVLLDEAYIEYCDQQSLAPMVANNKNIVVAKTFSKIYGLAGARIGYALAHPETIGQLAGLQPWQNAGASAVSLAGAIASLQDKDFVSSSKELNSKAGAFAARELKSLGCECIPSVTNFLYYSTKSIKGNWQELLRAKNILTGRVVEENGKWTRTTIGSMPEMEQFINAVKQIV